LPRERADPVGLSEKGEGGNRTDIQPPTEKEIVNMKQQIQQLQKDKEQWVRKEQKLQQDIKGLHEANRKLLNQTLNHDQTRPSKRTPG